MVNDNSTIRLLYAIISQHCLRDIDWEQVALDPVLAREINNGHAARMRFSRLKKQIEGTDSSSSSTSSSSNKASKKPRVCKSTSRSSSSRTKSRKGRSAHHARTIKEEDIDEDAQGEVYSDSFTSSISTNSAREMQTPDPDTGLSVASFHAHGKSQQQHHAGSSHQGMHSHAHMHHHHQHHHNVGDGYIPNTPLTSFSTPHDLSPYLPNRYESPSPNASFQAAALSMHDLSQVYANSFDSHHTCGMGTVGGGVGAGGGTLFGEMDDLGTNAGDYTLGMSHAHAGGLWDARQGVGRTRSLGGEDVDVKPEERGKQSFDHV